MFIIMCVDIFGVYSFLVVEIFKWEDKIFLDVKYFLVNNFMQVDFNFFINIISGFMMLLN